MLSVERKAEFLGSTSLFSSLSPPDLDRLAQRVGEHTAVPGEIIVEEGEPGDSVYFVYDGRIEIVKGNDDFEFILAIMEPGDLFGEMAALGGCSRTATARAAIQSTVLFLKEKALRLLIQQVPDIAFAVFRILAERVDATNDVIASIAGMGRVIGRLVVDEGPDQGQVYELRDSEVAIGRATGSMIEDMRRCALHEPEGAVKVDHAYIVHGEACFFLDPVEHGRTTALNGAPVDTIVELRSGDRIGIGSSTLIFEKAPV